VVGLLFFTCNFDISNLENTPNSPSRVSGSPHGGTEAHVFSILTLIFGELAVLFGFIGISQQTSPKSFLFMVPCVFLAIVFNFALILSTALFIGYVDGSVDGAERLWQQFFGWDGRISSTGQCYSQNNQWQNNNNEWPNNNNPNNNQWNNNNNNPNNMTICTSTLRLESCWRSVSTDGAIVLIFLSFLSLILFGINMYFLMTKLEEMEWSLSGLFQWCLLKAKNVLKYGFSGFHFSVNVTKRAFGLSAAHLRVKRKNDILFREITIHRTETLADLHSAILRAFMENNSKNVSLQVKTIIKNSEVVLDRDDDIQRLKSQDVLEVELENVSETTNMTKLEVEHLKGNSNSNGNVTNTNV